MPSFDFCPKLPLHPLPMPSPADLDQLLIGSLREISDNEIAKLLVVSDERGNSCFQVARFGTKPLLPYLAEQFRKRFIQKVGATAENIDDRLDGHLGTSGNVF